MTRWDVHDPTTIQQRGATLHGPTNYVYALTHTSDGRLLAAASTDGTIWIWDLNTTDHPQPYATLHTTGSAYAVAISHDNRTIAAGTADKTVQLWHLDPEHTATRICATLGQPITETEWRQYIPDLPQQNLCPA